MITQKRRAGKLFIFLFLISLLLSYIGIFSIENSTIMPNYFIALIISFIIANQANLNLYRLLFIGLGVDILAGQLIGQYALIFITIYIFDLLIKKIFVIKYNKQKESLSAALILLSFIILWITSKNYEIFIPFKTLLFQSVLTFITYLIFRVIINKYISR